MSSTAEQRRPAAPRAPLWLVGSVLWTIVLALLALHSAELGNSAAVGTLGVIFTSIVVEALPFILIGALVSGALATFVPDSAFLRLAALPRSLQVPGAALAGVCFPVCECGSVPVARRLLSRQLDPAAAVTFMLAAPVLNPIVLASTWVAYDARGDALEMTAARAGLGLAVAVVVGLAVARLMPGGVLRAGSETVPAHDHVHPHETSASAFAGRVTADFIFMGRFLVLGAAASALVQTLLPQSVLAGVGGTEVLAILSMIFLAFVLSLCSEADAFVAVSFTGFPLSAQLAFLTFGPALDAKLAVLYGATFRRRFMFVLVATALPLVVGGSLLFGAVV
jgi:uncharacterized membrane protein YraQ (UPF0718 family)